MNMIDSGKINDRLLYKLFYVFGYQGKYTGYYLKRMKCQIVYFMMNFTDK